MTVSPDLFRSGSQCPRCSAPLVADSVQAGRNYCTACSDEFEATTFRPPERRVRPTAEVITSGPEGAAACANHVRNAAVTSCQRCGLFICSLCDMNLGEGSFCPSCFERVRTEGALRTAITRYHDYAGMARLSILGGLLCFYLSPFLAPLGIFLGVKAIRQRREEGRTTAGVIILIIFAALELLGGLSMIGLLIWSLFTTIKGAPR
jgi:hypothetical protein